MGSRCLRRVDRRVQDARAPRLAVALLAAASFSAPAALAQGRPDAGAGRHSSTSAVPGARRIGAPLLKSIPNPSSVLADGVRARLAERAAARHPSEIAAHESATAEPKPGGVAPAPVAPPQHALSEPLRRGIAHQRRVQALDTGNGITVLSNRITEPPAPRLAALGASAAGDPEHAPVERQVSPNADSRVTETRSLRALSSRREVPKARERSLGADWLLWPFVLLVATGAVVGTLWFSKKTQ